MLLICLQAEVKENEAGVSALLSISNEEQFYRKRDLHVKQCILVSFSFLFWTFIITFYYHQSGTKICKHNYYRKSCCVSKQIYIFLTFWKIT